jgi:hypothetical protein
MGFINTNLSLPNEYTFGGIAQIFLADVNDISGFTATTAGTITGITGSFYEVNFLEETASINSEFTISNGNRYMIEGVTFAFPINTQADRNYFNELGKPDSKVVAAIIAKNGQKLILGLNAQKAGLKVLTAPYAIGAGVGDAFGVTVTLQEAAKGYPNFFSGNFTLSGGSYTLTA